MIKKANKQTNKQIRRQKAEETKELKRMSVENLTRYDFIICKFALCTFTYLVES